MARFLSSFARFLVRAAWRSCRRRWIKGSGVVVRERMSWSSVGGGGD